MEYALRCGAALLAIVLAPIAFAQRPAKDLEELERILRTADDGTDRARALYEMAKIGTEPAWKSIIRCLADNDMEVADAAHVCLNEVPDAIPHALWLGKQGLDSKDPLVRLRVALALRSMPATLDGKPIAGKLGDSDAEFRRTLLWGVEQAARDERVDDASAAAIRPVVQRMAQHDRVPDVRAAALCAWTALGGDGIEAAIDRAFGDKAWELRSAALLAAWMTSEAKALELGERALADASCSVRRQAITLLAGLSAHADGLAPGARALVAHLGSEKQYRLRQDVAKALQRLSGLEHGPDSEAWAEWAKLPKQREAKPDDEKEPAPTPVSGARLPATSERVVYLIDVSNSVRVEIEGGLIRLALIESALKQALDSLDRKAKFNVILYAEDFLPLADRMVEATSEMRQRALSFLSRRKDSGSGNLYGALLFALEDPEVDTIVLIGDGDSSDGPHTNTSIIFSRVWEKNRYRRVAIDVFLIKPSNFDSRWLWELARASDGEFTRIE